MADLQPVRGDRAWPAHQVGTWRYDAASGDVVLDDRATQLFGLPSPRSSRAEFLALTRLHPEDRERVRDAFSETLRSGNPFEEDCRITLPGGDVRWISVRGHGWLNEAQVVASIGGVLLDVTERNQLVYRDAFLVEVDDVLRHLDDPVAISAAAARLLCRHLRVDRCVYAEFDDRTGTFDFTSDYTADSEESAGGTTHMEDFGDAFAARLVAGQTFVTTDVAHDPEIADAARAAFAAAGIGATITVPVTVAGRLTAALAIHSKASRVWQPHDVDLVERVADRSWESLERARITRRLQEGERRLRITQRAGRVGGFEWAMSEDRIYWTQELEELYGLAPGTFEGRLADWRKRVVPEDAARVEQEIRECLHRRQTDLSYEFRAVLPDGQHRWLAGQATFDYTADGRPTEMLGVNVDIHERRQHEEAAGLLKAAIESANDAVIITEASLTAPGPRVEYVNPAFTALTGYESEDIIGRTPRILQGPDTDPALLVRLRHDLETKQRFQGEAVNYRKDGSKYFVEWRITPLRDRDGRVIKWAAIQRDVTGRVKADRVREGLLEAERAARTEMERVAKMKDEFLATLSHELRTPLNAIFGWTQVLTRGADPAVLRNGLSVIDRNARAQVQMIDDLLDMSRIISGTIKLDVQRVSLADVVQSATETVQPSADNKSVRLIRIIDPLAGPVSGDPFRLQQAVWNLLSNAVKFTPSGGRIQIVLERVNSHVEINVTDTGPGIAPDFLPFVFDRFRQADASTTRRFGGLGLGLSIVKQLVELHGGSVRAKSPGQGQGSTFSISLPLAPVQLGDAHAGTRFHPTTDGPDGPAMDGEPVSLTGVRVLVVEDDRDARDLIARVLGTAGAEVATADSVDRALERLRAERFTLLVSDIGMPERDGYELIRDVRALPDEQNGRIPAVALTAFARSEDRRRALRAGYQIHVAKPVEPAELLTVCASVINRVPRDDAPPPDPPAR